MTIHERATAWEYGYVPESLARTVQEHHGKAVSWHALARAGRAGYKKCGLEIEVTSRHTAEEVAGAILAMVAKHHGKSGCSLYRIDGLDKNGDRLNADGLPLRMSEEGADDVLDGSAAALLRMCGLLEKSAHDMHGRLIRTVDANVKMTEMVSECLEAMAGAVAEVCEVRLAMAQDDLEVRQEDHKHEKQMRFLDMFATAVGQKKGGAKAPTPLADFIKTLPADVSDALAEILGQRWATLCEAAQEPNLLKRRMEIKEILESLTADEKAQMGQRVPVEYQSQFQSALRAEMGAGMGDAA